MDGRLSAARAPLQRVAAWVAEVRARRPLVDRAVRTQERYTEVEAGQHAGAVTYYAFLSFFPVLALAVFVVGVLSNIYAQAQADLAEAIEQVMPGLLGSDPGEISLAQVRRFSGWAAIGGLAGVLYAGLGWVGATRLALEAVFGTLPEHRPNIVLVKLRDLLALALLGAVLFVSVIVSGLVTGFSEDVLDWLGADRALDWVLVALTRLAGIGVNVVLFYALFRLGRPRVPGRSLWGGALLGGLAFEVMKAVSFLLLASAKGSPAFQAFGTALIVLVWINYFARVVLYAAAWAWASPRARAAREDDAAGVVPSEPMEKDVR